MTSSGSGAALVAASYAALTHTYIYLFFTYLIFFFLLYILCLTYTCTMDVRPILFTLFLVLFMFTTVSGVSPASERPIVYTREQLLAFRSMAMLTGDRPAVPRELRRKRRGRRAGEKL